MKKSSNFGLIITTFSNLIIFLSILQIVLKWRTLMKLKINDELVYFEKTKKFKTISMGLYIQVPYKLENFFANSILCSLLTSTNESYKTMKELDNYSYDHYGLSIDGDIYSDGEITTFYFCTTFVNPKYLKEKIDLLSDAFELFHTTLLKPYYEDFQLEIKKDSYRNSLNNMLSRKSRLSYIKFFNCFLPNTLGNERIYPSPEYLESVTREKIEECYQYLIHSKRYFYLSGDVEQDTLINLFNKFTYPTVTYNVDNLNLVEAFPKKEKSFTDITDSTISQTSYLYVGFETTIDIYSEYVMPLKFLAKMMGGPSYSVGFKRIREERGLCYYIGCTPLCKSHSLFFESQINAENKDEVVSLIKEIVEDFKMGNFSDELLKIQKEQAIASIESSLDDVENIKRDVVRDIEKVKSVPINERIKRINEISKEDIVEAAKTLRLDTIYFMKGE